ncbi:hypothetical protein SEVIR_9G382000v4 [Setaria viridis]|uniref:Dirigent protein n=1 Tax=Setaria viridis TaxID=4556 RepID=A0A4U6T4Y8_SETVI|nr:hypothetical protein SEVIR_9G382000v2 [Setaria viridis]
MALNKNPSTCTSALLLLALFTFSQLLASQGRPLPTVSYITTMHGRTLLSHGSDSVPKGMVEGTVSPSSEIHGDKGSMVDADDVRPSTPRHSPGIGHAFINKNGLGRKL